MHLIDELIGVLLLCLLIIYKEYLRMTINRRYSSSEF